MRTLAFALMLAVVAAVPSAARGDDPAVGDPPYVRRHHGRHALGRRVRGDRSKTVAGRLVSADTGGGHGARGGRGRRPGASECLPVPGRSRLLHRLALDGSRRGHGDRSVAVCAVLLLDSGARRRQDGAPGACPACAHPGARAALPRDGRDPLHRLVSVGGEGPAPDLVRCRNRGKAPDGREELPRRARRHVVDQRAVVGRPAGRPSPRQRRELHPVSVRRRRRVAAAREGERLRRRAWPGDDKPVRVQEQPPQLACETPRSGRRWRARSDGGGRRPMRIPSTRSFPRRR